MGRELSGRVLGVLGMGRIGSEMARIGTVFGMDVIAWSLFARCDVLSIHLVLSDGTRGPGEWR